ncbi:MAG: hypothetical protein KIT31_42455, partial [Deltaproteobacteria bacterium]|nr:hypothetical protein [Deltaproteobacteria bacterium]
MKVGRVITAEEQAARAHAQQILEEARAQARQILDGARAQAGQVERDAERVAAQAGHARASSSGDDEAITLPGVGAAGAAAVPPGRVEEVTGLVVRATVPGVALGEIVRVDRRGAEPLVAEVVGFRGEQAVLLPLGELAGIAPACAVWRTGAPLSIAVGDGILSRVLDGIGRPIDGGPPLEGETWAVDRPAPAALARPPLSAPQPTGVRAIDTMLTLGRGQRVGLFAGAGVGKSTLLAMLAGADAFDTVVVALVGERGR